MTGRPAQIRLPLRPLLTAAARRADVSSISAAARLLGKERTVWRWQRDGGIPLASALKLADELGIHPVEIWGDDYIAIPADPADVIGWHINRIRIWLEDRQAAALTPRRRKAAVR